MATTGRTIRGSFDNVMRVHSAATVADDSLGSQARRPNAYQLAWLKSEPHQSRSFPMFATPARPRILAATSEPTPPVDPGAYVSARSTSSPSGARTTRWVSWPRYSLVT